MRGLVPLSLVVTKALCALILLGVPYQNSFGVDINEITAKLTFSYKESKPRIINGRPVYEDRYCACIESLVVTFPSPPIISTVFGSIIQKDSVGNTNALSVVEVSRAGNSLTFMIANGRSCNDWNPASTIEFSKDMRFEQGSSSRTTYRMDIPWPETSNHLPVPATKTLPLEISHVYLEFLEDYDETTESWVDKPKLSVSPSAINRAFKAQAVWERSAKLHSIYQNSGLNQFQMGSVFAPTSSRVLRNQFASSDLTYVLNRAGQFLASLWPQKKTVFLADMSNEKGETPSVGSGHDRIFRHPPGSHVRGLDVDIPYISIDGTADSKEIDWEANFWLVYSLLQNTGVDLVITAFKNEFIALAQQAYNQGLINHVALARFDSSRILLDKGLGHDDHLHVSVRNGDNDGVSKKFSLSDNVYNCYLKLKPRGRGTGGNFCDFR